MFLFFLSKMDSWVMLIPVTIFGTTAAGLAWRIWNESKRYGVPPDTSVSADFKFTRGKRWRFELFNDEFGEAFIEANRDSVYDRYSTDEINRRNRNALLTWGVIIVFLLYGLWNVVAEWIF